MKKSEKVSAFSVFVITHYFDLVSMSISAVATIANATNLGSYPTSDGHLLKEGDRHIR